MRIPFPRSVLETLASQDVNRASMSRVFAEFKEAEGGSQRTPHEPPPHAARPLPAPRWKDGSARWRTGSDSVVSLFASPVPANGTATYFPLARDRRSTATTKVRINQVRRIRVGGEFSPSWGSTANSLAIHRHPTPLIADNTKQRFRRGEPDAVG